MRPRTLVAAFAVLLVGSLTACAGSPSSSSSSSSPSSVSTSSASASAESSTESSTASSYASSTAASQTSSAGGPAGSTPASGSSSATVPTGPTDTFPVTVKSALGTATIPSAPQRVVTLGWGSTDAAIALGVAPVAIEKQTYGGDAQGLLPWIKDALAAGGMATPTLMASANTGEVPFDAILAAKPDLILAPYSGITADQYAKLAKIAPTVAYPDKAWSTSWQDVITITATALGRSAAGQAVLTRIEAYNASVKAAHPGWSGKTFASVWDSPTTNSMFVYTKDDARVQVLTGFGLTVAPAVSTLYSGTATFYYTLSYEKADQLTSDYAILYADTEAAAQAFLTGKGGSAMPAVKAKHVVSVVGQAAVAAVSPPTALSYDYAMPQLVSKMAAVIG